MSVSFHLPHTPTRPPRQEPILSPKTPPMISAPQFSSEPYSSPLVKRQVTEITSNLSPSPCKIGRVSEDMFKPVLSENRYGKARPANPKKAPPSTPRPANKCKSILDNPSPFQQLKIDKFNKARNECDRARSGLRCIGTGRFHNTYAIGDREVVKTPNEEEFRKSENKGIIFERITFAENNYQTLLQAKAAGLLPDLEIMETKFDCEHAIIRQARCAHLLTQEDLKKPELIHKLARTFASAYKHNIPLDVKTNNLALIDGNLYIFDFLEAYVGSFRVRTQVLLEETAEGNEALFRALDPRPPGFTD